MKQRKRKRITSTLKLKHWICSTFTNKIFKGKINIEIKWFRWNYESFHNDHQIHQNFIEHKNIIRFIFAIFWFNNCINVLIGNYSFKLLRIIKVKIVQMKIRKTKIIWIKSLFTRAHVWCEINTIFAVICCLIARDMGHVYRITVYYMYYNMKWILHSRIIHLSNDI